MPRKSPYKIVLSDNEKNYLQEVARKYTLPHYQVLRAKIILMAAEGFDNKEIGQKLDVPRPKVSKWRKRFFYQRMAGLMDQPRPGRPSHFSP